MALTLWCFCPNILAHGQLVTPDCGATAVGLTACYCFWRWLKSPGWWLVVASGICLGAAELTKFTWIVLIPLWPMSWVFYRVCNRQAQRSGTWIRELFMLVTIALLAIYIINLGYGFEGIGTRLGDFHFVSSAFAVQNSDDVVPLGGANRFASSWLADLPIPLPKNYILGIDLQRRDLENPPLLSYLRGEFRPHGWWYYYLYAMAIKVPLGTWLLAGLSIATRARALPPRINIADESVLLVPAAAILAAVSSQSSFNEHFRYVLPAFPFIFIWIGRVAAVFGSDSKSDG